MRCINQIRSGLAVFLSIMSIGSFGQVQMNFEFEIPYRSNDEVGKYVNINGIKMYYEEYGVGDPLLLIHGLGVISNPWEIKLITSSQNTESFQWIAGDMEKQNLIQIP